VDDNVKTMLTTTKTWAVVGCSPDPGRDSNRIAAMLKHRGFTIVPVNPREQEILGERCYPTVADIPQDVAVDVVDIFRRSDAAGEHVDEAIRRGGVKGVWMQLGVIDEDAAKRARHAGLLVAMDRCPAIELPRLATG
jgi:predicted CoA-binding protein